MVSTVIRNMTFENGAIVDASTGGDATGGSNAASLVPDAVNPLKGVYSAHVPGISDAYVQKTLSPAVDDLYVTFYLRLNANPGTIVIVAQVGSTVVGQLRATTTGKLRLTNNGTQVGSDSSTLTVGQTYRILLHQKKGTGSNGVLEAYLAQGETAFGAPFANTSTGTFTASASQFRIGNLSLTTNTADISFDNVLLTLPAHKEHRRR